MKKLGDNILTILFIGFGLIMAFCVFYQWLIGFIIPIILLAIIMPVMEKFLGLIYKDKK